MPESAVSGMSLFFSKEVGCSNCHVGANLADEKYHNLGVGMDSEMPDMGRFTETKDDKDKGAFKTPTIRNVALSAPLHAQWKSEDAGRSRRTLRQRWHQKPVAE